MTDALIGKVRDALWLLHGGDLDPRVFDADARHAIKAVLEHYSEPGNVSNEMDREFINCAALLRRGKADEVIPKAIAAAIYAKQTADGEVERLKAALAPFVTLTKTDGPVWYYENADDSVIVRCELTVGEIRKAREVLEGKQ